MNGSSVRLDLRGRATIRTNRRTRRPKSCIWVGGNITEQQMHMIFRLSRLGLKLKPVLFLFIFSLSFFEYKQHIDPIEPWRLYIYMTICVKTQILKLSFPILIKNGTERVDITPSNQMHVKNITIVFEKENRIRMSSSIQFNTLAL